MNSNIRYDRTADDPLEGPYADLPMNEIAAHTALLTELVKQLNDIRQEVAWLAKLQEESNRIQANSSVLLRLRRRISPRLFRLDQGPPRRLVVPARYHQTQLPESLPLISIVTPSFNQAQFLPRTLESVLGQDYPRLEYVVQDGGSKDGSVDVLRQFDSRLTRWESAPDDGQSDAINRGFRHTSGAIMGWLNSDDLLLPGTLRCVARYFERHPNVDVVYGSRYIINETGHEVGRWLLPSHDDEVLRWVDYVPQETLFWRREIWERSGGRIDESFDFAMDWDLILRFQSAGARFACIPRFLGAFRVTPDTKTSRQINTVGQSEVDRLRLRTLGFVPTQADVQAILRPYLRRHIFMRLLNRLKIVRY